MKRLVIANRGEIARRVLRAARNYGWVVAVISTADDRDAPVRLEADAVLEVDSFLNGSAIVQEARRWRADLIHPGYGFLSENSEFAQLVEDAGIAFIGPTSANMRAMGGKESAKAFARRCGVPTLEALMSAELQSLPVQQWADALEKRGIVAPYLVKASGGGGGRGMRVVNDIAELSDAVKRASQEAQASFNDPTVFVERYLLAPRHVEIQVFGDGRGGGVFLGERECSLQRRHQKVMEEAPSSVVDAALREQMGRASLALVAETQYRGAGTVEFLLTSKGEFYFLEMNTRLQVEHPVTELVYGVDLVQAQFDLALGHWPRSLPRPDVFSLPEPRGVAIEARLLAEDPRAGFLPTPGPLVVYQEAEGAGVRVDSGVREGGRVNDRFDSMISKVIVHAPTRAAACELLSSALESTVVHGCTTNVSFLNKISRHSDYISGAVSTAWIGDNLQTLTSSFIPDTLAEFFHRYEIRRCLAFALQNAGSERVLSLKRSTFSERRPDACAGVFGLSQPSAEIGARFAALRTSSSPSYSGHSIHSSESSAEMMRNSRLLAINECLAVGAEREYFALEIVPAGSAHQYRLGGRGLQQVLAGLSRECLEQSPQSLRVASESAKLGSAADIDVLCWLSRPRGQHLQITLFGETLTLDWPDDTRAQWEVAAQDGAADTLLRAPMAGKVLEVRVIDGDRVSEGDLLFVLESMKMQLEIRSPRAGQIVGVRVSAGMTLAGPDVLAEITEFE
jgi:acetyl/propionyl-CoA carboxylase alpha subunit